MSGAASARKPLIAVTGSDKPYIYDLPHMLSLPTGFEFRFRYRHAWIESQLGKAIATAPETLRGRPLIVIFHSAGKGHLLPVRRCRVVNVESAGPIIYLRFRVEEFVCVPRSTVEPGPVPSVDAWAKLHASAIELFGDTLAGKDLSKPLGNGFYLREAATDPADLWSAAKAAKAADDWAVLAQVLGEESSFWDVPMFYLLGFQQTNGKYAKAGALLFRSANVRGFWWRRPRVRANKLVENKRYRLRVLEWCKPRDDKHPLAVNVSCKFDDRMLLLESAASLVVGKYDILEFSFLAKRAAFGLLELRADPEGKPTASAVAPDWPRLYAARVPVSIRQSIPRITIVVVFFLAGIATYQRPEKLQEWTKVPPSLWQLIGTILIFVVLGEVIDRFLKFSKDLRDYSQPPTPPTPKP